MGEAPAVRAEVEDVPALRRALQPDPQEQLVPGVDLDVVERRWMHHERRKLVVLDVDSTLIRQEVIDSRGAADAAYIRKVIDTQRKLELGSRAVLLGSALPPLAPCPPRPPPRPPPTPS